MQRLETSKSQWHPRKSTISAYKNSLDWQVPHTIVVNRRQPNEPPPYFSLLSFLFFFLIEESVGFFNKVVYYSFARYISIYSPKTSTIYVELELGCSATTIGCVLNIFLKKFKFFLFWINFIYIFISFRCANIKIILKK